MIQVIYKERESVLYHGIKYRDRGKELFRVLYIASQTNKYLKRKLK